MDFPDWISQKSSCLISEPVAGTGPEEPRAFFHRSQVQLFRRPGSMTYGRLDHNDLGLSENLGENHGKPLNPLVYDGNLPYEIAELNMGIPHFQTDPFGYLEHIV